MGYKLKRILIYPDGVTEKQVYPAYRYTYDFRGKTETQIYNEGWVKYSGQISLDSNGLTSPTGYDFNLVYPITLSNANKITIKLSIAYNIYRADYAVIYGVSATNNPGQNYSSFYLASNQIYGGTRVRMRNSGTYTDGSNIGGISRTSYNPELEIDLKNKKITGKLEGFSNSTLTLTDANVSFIRSMGGLYLYTTQGNFYIQTIDAKIDY